MDRSGRRRMHRLFEVYDYLVAAVCVGAFVVALVLGVGAESLLFLVAAGFWAGFGAYWGRRARR